MSADTIDLPEIKPVSSTQAAPEDTGAEPDGHRGWQVIAALVLLLVSALIADQVIRSGYFTIEKVTVSNGLTHVDRGIAERTAWRGIHGNYLVVSKVV